MLLYELAIDLDVRSPDLVDAARELGFGDLQAGSDIDAQQVAALRARFGQAAPTPLPPPAVEVAPAAGPAPKAGRFKRKRGSDPSVPPPAAWGAPAPSSPGATPGAAVWGSPDPAAPMPAAPPAPPAAAPAAPSHPAAGPAAWNPPTPAAAAPAGAGPMGFAPPPASSVPPQGAPPFSGPPQGAPAFGAPVAPADWGPPPPRPPSAATAGASSPGFSKVQIAAVGAVALLAVGLFAFMFLNTGGDEGAARSDGSSVDVDDLDDLDGPDPDDPDVDGPAAEEAARSEKEMADIAKWDAVKKENEERLCNELKELSRLDRIASSAIRNATTIEELKAAIADGTGPTVAAYDRLIPLIPEQAQGLRELRQFTIDFSANIQGASNPAQLQQRITDMSMQAGSSSVGQAAIALDRFATDTCGVSTGRN